MKINLINYFDLNSLKIKLEIIIFDKDVVKFGSGLNKLMRGNMRDTAVDQK